VVAVGHAVWLAATLPAFAMTSPTIVAALVIVTLLSALGFGVLLPGEIRMYLETTSNDPDETVISDIRMRNAKLAGVQGALQVAIIFVMVYVRVRV
jgi:predicted type IV restriction endonuclease